MSIKRTIITTVVALALVAVVAPVASAQTMTIAQQIAQLQAQLQALLQSSGSTSTSATPSACVGVTFTRNLTVGATGSDVQCLQAILNLSATTQVATTGAGSPGMETTYFGSRTLAAVQKFQSANGLTPASQVGPLTRAKLNAWLSGSTTSTTTTTTSTGPVSATLAVDNPAAGSLIPSEATADLLHINFTGSGTVTSVTLQRSGISDQNTLTNVYLFDGNTRITDGYSFNSQGQIVMNGLSIPVNGSHVISVRADVAASTIVSASGSNPASSIAVTLTGYTAGTAATVNVMGNTMQIVSGTAAVVYVNANTVYNSNTQVSVNAGTTQYTFWSSPIQVNTRTVMLKGANFRMIGSAPTNALSNIKLFVDGIDTGKVGTITTINGSTYASFDLSSSPISLTTGSHTIDVRADVQAGANRTIQLSLQQASDLTVSDPQVGVNIAVGGVSNASFSANLGANVLIAYGTTTVNVDPTFNSQTNVAAGATNIVIGRFIVHAYGEDVKVMSLNVTPKITDAATNGSCETDGSGAVTAGTCGLNNVTLYFNGSQVGSQKNWSSSDMNSATTIPFTLGSQMIAPAGQDSTLEVRADLQTSGNESYNQGTVTVTLPSETTNAQGQSSQNTVGVPSAQVGPTNGLSISSTSLVASKNAAYSNQTINPNTTGAKIGSYVIQNQSTSESIRITQLEVALKTTGGTQLSGVTAPLLSNFSALRTSDTTGGGATPVQPTGDDRFSVNDTLAPGAQMTVDIFANTGTDSTNSFKTQLNVSFIGATSNLSNTTGLQDGQTIGLGAGTISTPTLVVSSSTPAEYLAGGTGSTSQATFNFVANTAAVQINELRFVVSDTGATNNTVTNVCVGSVCAAPSSGTAKLTFSTPLSVPTGGGLLQNVTVSYAPVGLSGLTPGTLSTIGLAYAKYATGSSTKTICTSTIGGCDATLTGSGTGGLVLSNAMTLVSSVPTVTVSQTSPASGLILSSGAENKIGEVTVAAGTQGSIKVRQLVFTVGFGGFSANPTFTSFRLANGSTTITGASCTGSTTVTCTFNSGSGSTYATDFQIAAGSQQVFSLYGTFNSAGTLNSGSTGSVSTAVSSGSFLWDDPSTAGASTSSNGISSNGTGLTGSSIYNFPTNAYSIHQ